MESRLVLLVCCKEMWTDLFAVWLTVDPYRNYRDLSRGQPQRPGWGRMREGMGLGDRCYIRPASLTCIWLHLKLWAFPHHFPPKFSARIAIILSSDPSTALWIITGLCNCPSRLGERGGKKVTQQGVGWWLCQKISHWYRDKMIRPE